MTKESNYNFPLPERLERFRGLLEATIEPYIAIKTEFARTATLWQSKFVGLPYLPKNVEFPKTPQGDYLYLLAQINFAEVPHIEGFPKQGILQFYISDAKDFSYGKDFDDLANQSGFRVLYFPEIEQDESNLITNFDFLPFLWDGNDLPFSYYPSENDFLTPTDCLALKFEQKYAPITAWDYRCRELIGNDFFLEVDDDADDAEEEEYRQTWNEYIRLTVPSYQLMLRRRINEMI